MKEHVFFNENLLACSLFPDETLNDQEAWEAYQEHQERLRQEDEWELRSSTTRQPKIGKIRRNRILSAWNNKCYYCGIPLNAAVKKTTFNGPCLDHVIPTSKGGPNTDENLVASCRDCNTRKGSKDKEGFREYLNKRHSSRLLYDAILTHIFECGFPTEAGPHVTGLLAYLEEEIANLRVVFHGEKQ